MFLFYQINGLMTPRQKKTNAPIDSPYLILFVFSISDKWHQDSSRLLITMGVHQKEQLNYLQNIQMMVNNINTIPTDIDNYTAKNKKEDIIYCQFPATSLDVLNKLDNEVKVLES